MILALLACAEAPSPVEEEAPGCAMVTRYADRDGDGYGGLAVTGCDVDGAEVAGDCDDGDDAIHPGAAESCDGVDEDCDGAGDAGAVDAPTWYADADGDGWGDAPATACQRPEGYAAREGDCDDADPAVSPDGVEVCDGVDQDCDGELDEDVAAPPVWHADVDGDGFGDAEATLLGCEAPAGWVEDDADCDDADATVLPGAIETCDGIDEDCDGEVDEDPAGAPVWYLDDDEDGYGDAASTASACDPPAGYVADGTDCDDRDGRVSPVCLEVCDGVDQDCDGVADDDAYDGGTWYADADGDGYGDPATATTSCFAPAGYIPDDDDCDDTDATVSPAGVEVCDGVDQDCDGVADDALSGAPTWYADHDGDGYGDPDVTRTACAAPTGYVADASDCDDRDATASPAGVETCDGADQDCDGATDETGTDAPSWYADLDGDGYGDATNATVACDAPAGWLADDTDCDDTRDDVYPGAAEADCEDPVDYNCDGSTGAEDADGDGAVACLDCDDADATTAEGSTWYADVDGDGYGSRRTSTASCTQPSGYVADATDCRDSDAAAYPGAPEDCSTPADDDCDGDGNGRDGPGCQDYYLDDDGDGYGSTSHRCYCRVTDAWNAMTSTDCDDGDADAHPGAAEVWGNGADDDCDGTTDTFQLAEEAFELRGESSDDAAGIALDFVGDIDADGYDDLVVGAYGSDVGNAGAAFVVRGPVEESATLDAADTRWVGDSSGDAAGGAVSRAGDVDGDGLPDLLVGAAGDDDGGSSAGAVHLVTTVGSARESLSSATAKLVGDAASDVFGSAVAGAGDLDGDGHADVAAGAYGSDLAGRDAGAAYLFLGPLAGTVSATAADATLLGEAASDYAGKALAGGEDLDGDGVSDLAVGAWGAGGANEGRVYVLYGPIAGTLSLSAADATIAGAATSDTLGRALAIVPDDDGDGYADLLAGSYTASDAGEAYLFAGPLPATGTTTAADATFSAGDGSVFLAWSLAAAGDLDGDGAGEVVIGDPSAAPDVDSPGAAYVFYGPHAGARTTEDAGVTFWGAEDEDSAGGALAGGGDTDGDGVPDLLVGAWEWSASDEGVAYLVLGP